MRRLLITVQLYKRCLNSVVFNIFFNNTVTVFPLCGNPDNVHQIFPPEIYENIFTLLMRVLIASIIVHQLSNYICTIIGCAFKCMDISNASARYEQIFLRQLKSILSSFKCNYSMTTTMMINTATTMTMTMLMMMANIQYSLGNKTDWKYDRVTTHFL